MFIRVVSPTVDDDAQILMGEEEAECLGTAEAPEGKDKQSVVHRDCDDNSHNHNDPDHNYCCHRC